MSDCIFCRIARKEAPASIVFEDDEILAFPTIRQTQPGEILIIPKQHIDEFCDIAEDTAGRIIALGQRIARLLRQDFKPKRVGYVVSGFGVSHAHLIVLPLHNEQDITSERYITLDGGKVSFGMGHITETPRAELDQMAAHLSHGLKARFG